MYKANGSMVMAMLFNATFNNIPIIVAVSFIIGGNRSTRSTRSTRRKPPTCRRSLTAFICCIEYSQL